MRCLLVCLGMVCALAMPIARGPSMGAEGRIIGGTIPVGNLQRDAPGGTATVRGTVVTADTGEPARRATVTLTVASQARRADNDQPSLLSTTTDGNGQFEFTRVPAGMVTVSAFKDGYYGGAWTERTRLNASAGTLLSRSARGRRWKE